MNNKYTNAFAEIYQFKREHIINAITSPHTPLVSPLLSDKNNFQSIKENKDKMNFKLSDLKIFLLLQLIKRKTVKVKEVMIIKNH